MRIVVLGGTGFIGMRVCRELRDHDVWVVHRGITNPYMEGITHVQGARETLREHQSLFKHIRPDAVLDMTPRNGQEAREVLLTLGPLDPRFVAVSSGSVYRSFGILLGTEVGQVSNNPYSEDGLLRRELYPYRGRQPREQTDPRRWLDDYDKILAERAYLDWSRPASIIRLPMVYGPDDPDERVLAYLRSMEAGCQEIVLNEAAASWRNSRTYVDNAAHAIARVLLCGVPGRIYNVSEVDDPPEAAWVQAIGAQLGWRGRVKAVDIDTPGSSPRLAEFPSGANFRQHLLMDSARIRCELGYAERISRDAALKATVDAASAPKRQALRTEAHGTGSLTTP